MPGVRVAQHGVHHAVHRQRVFPGVGLVHPQRFAVAAHQQVFRAVHEAQRRGVEALTKRDLEIARTVGPELRKRGLLFVGLDVIGEHLTEINVTSPTCIREIDKAFDTRIGERLMDAIAAKLAARTTS